MAMLYGLWVLLGPGCKRDVAATPEVKKEPNLVRASDDDADLAAATERARSTLQTFLAAVGAPEDDHRYGIKVALRTRRGYEHLWLGELELEPEADGAAARLCGVIDNEPKWSEAFHIGDAYCEDPAAITDWQIVDAAGRVHGAWTTRALVERMAEPERERFLARSGLVFAPDDL